MEDFELQDIKDKFKRVIKYSQGINNPKVDTLFDRWLEAKQDFIATMGGKLIYEYPEKIAFTLDEQSKNNLVADFVDRIYGYYCCYELGKYISSVGKDFFSGTVQKPYLSEDGKIAVPVGIKFIKSFKYFVDDETTLRRIQDEASMIIQKDKIEGKLCFSVHPLDFLSSSENTHNWRSCHALDGEYKAGNLSYMVDKSTVICYLKSEQDDVLPNFPSDVRWNNKKWRMLLFFSNNWEMLFAGRQYPFMSPDAAPIVTNVLLPAISNDLGNWGMWNDGRIESVPEHLNVDYEKHHLVHTYIPICNELYALTDVVRDGEGALNFNDLLRSSCYKPIYCFKNYRYRYPCIDNNDDFRFVIGGSVPCLECGEHDVTIGEVMRCIRCEELYGDGDSEYFNYCACCGRRYYNDNTTWVNDDPICPTCVEMGEVVRCSNCGEWIYKSDSRYDEVNDTDVCAWCYEDIDRTRKMRPRHMNLDF